MGAPLSLTAAYSSAWPCSRLCAGVLRYAEQACNHFIAFKLLALIRDKVFRALRRLCPAKLEGRDRGDLISVITSDIELLEVFYAHTISPVAIAAAVSAWSCACSSAAGIRVLGLLALAAYLYGGRGDPAGDVPTQRGDDGLRFRTRVRRAERLCAGQPARPAPRRSPVRPGRGRLAEMDARTERPAADEAADEAHRRAQPGA